MVCEVAFKRRKGENRRIRPETGLGEAEEGRVLPYQPKALFGRGYASYGFVLAILLDRIMPMVSALFRPLLSVSIRCNPESG